MAVTDDAITRIKAMILAGDLAPGDRLPPEKELGERLGLSRSSMREAVKALEVIRVLDVRQGDGTYVSSLEPALLVEAISFVVDLHVDRSVIQLFEVRRILEGAAARLAASHITPDQLAALHEHLTSAPVTDDVEQLVQHDLMFHSQLVAASGNSYLAALIDSLSTSTVRARMWRGVTQKGAVARTLEEHRSILAAVEAADTQLAEALAVAHISGVEGWLKGQVA
ncbi:FadR/GntR family transcriptional regulator [Microbacterium sp.]|uniref:FadR/GntR family transcriptional regulator n=1 Tax=Microbacterium sp. TaxID=51671 RepID=UPI003F6E539D